MPVKVVKNILPRLKIICLASMKNYTALHSQYMKRNGKRCFEPNSMRNFVPLVRYVVFGNVCEPPEKTTGETES